MSALDLFASALGAFILIAIILFPFFPTTKETSTSGLDEQALESAQSQISELQQQLADRQQQLLDLQNQLKAIQDAATSSERAEAAVAAAQQQIQQCNNLLQDTQRSEKSSESQNEQLRRELEQCQQLARRTFLLIVISWSTRDDVDLHVVDPQGREFFWERRSFAGTPAKLEEDNIVGPGNEIWLHPSASTGTYQISYRYYTRRSSKAEVRGSVLVQSGRLALPDITLRRLGEKPRVATITVDARGDVLIGP